MKKGYFDRPTSHASPFQLWLRSQLLYWISTLLAVLADHAGRETMGIAWQRGTFDMPTPLIAAVMFFWLVSLALLVLSAVDLARQHNSIVGGVAALAMVAGTVATTLFAFGIVMVIYAEFSGQSLC